VTLKTPSVKTQKASDLINLDTYTAEEHLIVSKAKQDKTYVGRAYSMSPIVGGGGEFATVIQNIFKSCPDDSVIQVSLISEPDYDAAGIYASHKLHGGQMVQELVQKQKDVLIAATKIGWQADVPLLNKRTLLISLAVPAKLINEEVMSEASALQTDFLNNMRGCGFSDANPISAGQLVGYYRQFGSIFTPAKEVRLDEMLELKFQVFGPDQTIDFSDNKVGVFDGNTFCAEVTAKAYPESGYHGLMSVLTGAPFNNGSTREGGGQRILTPFIFNTTIRVANQRKEMERVENAIKSRQNSQTLPFKLGNEDPHQAMIDLEYMKKQCSSDGDKFVYVSTTAFVFGRTKEQAIDVAMTLKGSFDKLGFDGRLIRNDGIVRWAQALPLNFAPSIAERLKSECIMPSSAAGCLLPVYGDHTGNAITASKNTGSAFVTRRGAAHFFDPFISDSNYNGTIAAAPGSGKSFVLQYIIQNSLAEGSNIFLFDNGRSAKKLCAAVNGEFNEFSLSSTDMPSLNPFTGMTDSDFDEQQEVITSLLLLMAFENESPHSGARIAMSEAVRAAYGKLQGDAEISTVIDSLETIRASAEAKADLNEVERAAGNLVPRLRAFLESPTRGQFFRGKGTINPTKQFTVFELGGLSGDEHLRKCVMFFVLNMLMSRIKQVKGRKLVLVDEAHDLFKDPAAATVMEGIYLKGRKDLVGVFVIVQSLLKLAETSTGRVILNQSAWKLILAQKSEEVTKLFNENILTAFAGDPYFKKLTESIETRKGIFSEILFIGDRYYEAARLYVDKFTSTLFSSEGDARDAVFDLMQQGVGAVDAVYQVMNDKKRSRKQFLQTVIDQLFYEDPQLTKTELMGSVRELIK
jgi:conjugal transfer ATP-binding protein TraC